ncbi:MAG: flagellar basal body rod protein FlgC [Rhodothermales bacterium]
MLINRFFSVFRTAARGMEAQRIAMSTASENIANASTTRTQDGTPYDIKRAVHTGTGDRYTSFANTLNKMRSEMLTTDQRHISSPGFAPEMQSLELGPTTEVQAEERIRMEFDPQHPHADENGYVAYPDINVVDEMARMISANRVYEANLSAVQSAKEIIKRTLEI